MKKSKKILLLILLLTLLKVAMLFLFEFNVLTFENTAIAKNFLADGKMYYLLDGNIDYNHQFPFYGWVLICFFKVFGVFMMPVQLFQIFLNAFFAWVAWELFELNFSALASKTWTGFVLVIIATCHPLLVNYQLATIHPVTLDILLFALLMLVSLIWSRNPSRQMTLLLVLILGITLLERSTLAVAILPAAIISLKEKMKLFQLVMIAIVSVVIFAFPWMVRNHNLTGKYQLTSGTWRYMWVGVQEKTDGTNVLTNGNSYYDLFPQDIKDEWGSRNLEAQMSFYRDGYLQVLHDNPSQILYMWGVKMKNMFWFTKQAGGDQKSSNWLLVYKVLHGSLLFLFILGLFSGYRKQLVLLLSAGVLLALIQSFFYVETRHALPFHFVLWIGAICGLWYLASRIVRNKNV